MASFLRRMGQWDAAAAELERAATILADLGPEQYRAWAETRRELARLYESQGRFSEAALVRGALLERDREALPAGDAEIGNDLNGLGLLCYRQGHLDRAGDLLREAINVQRDLLPGAAREYAASLDNLGLVEHDTGNYSDAERLHLKAADLFRTAGTEADWATALNNAGEVYLATGRLEEAKAFLERALDVRRRSLANEPDLARSVMNVATLRLAEGHPDAAEELLHEASAIWRAAGVPDTHPDVLKTNSSLAALALEPGREEESLSLGTHVLELQVAAIGENHPDVGDSLDIVASALTALGRVAEAEEVYKRAIAVYARLWVITTRRPRPYSRASRFSSWVTGDARRR